ncbi:MAG TPA: formate-dependent phosphoribosylglycinamide formyltransferase [Cyclobacteriaceae bacterium]|nr:formate-dependent phosphoribosylglycinamide formyltransferase [Cyclobacteriaceae bacterium]HMV08120.1 formate-dependent phosphoribosylglycinamide formyltransferase [Cyclobacteriaceae bacterium]HMV88334.1 formate-dependent phosphoribosylglycinamide formyltransferase [Cyclobacteriaceae bacterium]HMX00761.1 formate-dependent phosphoribosylglycinamide formyltransferase [Cyclobacteriaceae bacterium]HMX49364.1 formate-dependent phosphoribosylglycinamide formyltransferase [Cyclobacteriaceae bacteri
MNSILHIGTPLKSSAIKIMMLGSGELGKEVVIEFQRYGVEVIAVDRYPHAPAMQVAHRSYAISMLDGKALRTLIEKEKPDYIIPEVEAIATDTLVELEREGFKVIPCANATRLTMNREGIRTLAAQTLKLQTSPYKFAGNKTEFDAAIKVIGMPCVVKPIMSSSGKGQSVVKSEKDIDHAWQYAQEGGRSGGGRVIIEGFIDFDYEITLLTIRHKNGISFCEPIGHRQEHGDYQESWQPHPMSEKALKHAQHIAASVVDALGGHGIFGVEFFVKGDTVYFSELSPRPHDTGMVTMISQDLSEFALHVRAILGLPIPNIVQHGPSASSVILVKGDSDNITFSGIEKALELPDTQIRLFGKPEVRGERRMGVCLARGASIEDARKKANAAAANINYTFH